MYIIPHLMRTRCRYCRTERHFVPDDLRRLFGDVECDDLLYLMSCSTCRQQRTLDVETASPSAADRQKMTIRRLDKIYYVRRARWRDERA